MLSKAQIKYIKSLRTQKYRLESRAFIAEGDKIACEWLSVKDPITHIVALESWLRQHDHLLKNHPEASVYEVDEATLLSISSLKSAQSALLVVKMPEPLLSFQINGWCIALDRLQDPGNMGTIIRIADWFGISLIVCSPDCVDVYNSKVVQAAMGGHLRVQFLEADLERYLENTSMPIYAAVLNGDNLYQSQQAKEGVLLIGNESQGLAPQLLKLATNRVSIPRFGGAESLNAAVATGIICSHLIQH
ncbi:MAG: RNA methyltransferase [Bacteroidetes bacterium]|nr:RNA methyltransferase [Bacteroidota bacterium]